MFQRATIQNKEYTSSTCLMETSHRIQSWNIALIVLCSFGTALSLLTLFILIGRNLLNISFMDHSL